MSTNKTNQVKGFTLIEIIAVLVILGILAAVALPRYTALTQTAREKALYEGISAAKSHLNLTYFKLLFEGNGAAPALDEVVTNADCSNSITGSFSIQCDSSGVITVTDDTGASATDTWESP